MQSYAQQLVDSLIDSFKYHQPILIHMVNCGACGASGHTVRTCRTPLKKTGSLRSGATVAHCKHPKSWRCSCGGWIHHYRKFSGSNRTTCCKEGCSNRAEDGAHVRRIRGKGIVLIPLCPTCNRSWAQRPGRKFKVNKCKWVNANTKISRCSER